MRQASTIDNPRSINQNTVRDEKTPSLVLGSGLVRTGGKRYVRPTRSLLRMSTGVLLHANIRAHPTTTNQPVQPGQTRRHTQPSRLRNPIHDALTANKVSNFSVPRSGSGTRQSTSVGNGRAPERFTSLRPLSLPPRGSPSRLPIGRAAPASPWGARGAHPGGLAARPAASPGWGT